MAELEKLAAATVPDMIAPDAPPVRALPPNPSRVVSQRAVVQGGRTITTQLMEGPPPAKPTTAPAAVSQRVKEEEDIAERKHHATLFLSNTVYNNAVTEMRWTREGREYKVFTNIDFTVFRGVGRIETEKADYSLVLGIGDTLLEPGDIPPSKDFPGPDFFTATNITFLPAASNPPGIVETPEYQALPDILNHYAAHEHDLRWKQAVLKAENAARQRWLDAYPEKPKDATVRFWPVRRPEPSPSK